ncbi:MAG TPA: hypothetical protein VI172_13705 [Candidatus Dormibacteraeota bacterium]
MGQSTDAILFYGYCWTEETSKPWTIGKDDGDDGDEGWEDRWARVKGLTHPAERYPELRDRKTWKDREPTVAEAEVIEKYRAYWAAKKALTDAAGCVVDTHCSNECPMPLVAVKASTTRAWRGSPPQEISGIAVDPAWPTMLDEFCTTMGIPVEGRKVGWWLVSDWS